jgi:hypothetical protein
MITPRALVWLIVGALGLPIAICVLLALQKLLEAMKDDAGAYGLGRVGLALFVVWLIDLIALSIVTAINSLGGGMPRENETEAGTKLHER